jgi:hypothetical protein
LVEGGKVNLAASEEQVLAGRLFIAPHPKVRQKNRRSHDGAHPCLQPVLRPG